MAPDKRDAGRSGLPVRHRPQSLEDLLARGAQADRVVRLAQARVVVAGTGAIRALPGLADAPRGRIERWLLSQTAVVSVSQSAQTRVNTPLRTVAGSMRTGTRFGRMGRSVDLAVTWPEGLGGGVVNVKGVGVPCDSEPVLAPQANGLLPLHCALYEFILHRLVGAALARMGSPHGVLPALAVLSVGSDELDAAGLPLWPAGLLVRQGHYRHPEVDLAPFGSRQQLAAAQIELSLRRLGLSSAFTSPWLCRAMDGTVGPADGARFRRAGAGLAPEPRLAEALDRLLDGLADGAVDAVNVQMTEQTWWPQGAFELLDLHYAIRSRFTLPLASTVNDRVLGLAGILTPDHPHFVQPAPAAADWARQWEQPAATATPPRADDAGACQGLMLHCLTAARTVAAGGLLPDRFVSDIVEPFVAMARTIPDSELFRPA